MGIGYAQVFPSFQECEHQRKATRPVSCCKCVPWKSTVSEASVGFHGCWPVCFLCVFACQWVPSVLAFHPLFSPSKNLSSLSFVPRRLASAHWGFCRTDSLVRSCLLCSLVWQISVSVLKDSFSEFSLGKQCNIVRCSCCCQGSNALCSSTRP